MKKAFLIWGREVKLSEYLSRELEAEIVISYFKKWRGYELPAFFRYILQGVDSYRKLRLCRPDIIFVQNPPITAVLLAYLYCLLNQKANFAIDTHTAGFLDKKWVYFHFLNKFLAKKAILNTVHNYKNLEFLTKWEIADAYVLQFYNPEKDEILNEKIELPDQIKRKILENLGMKIFMVNRFASDDAWREVVATARTMPWATFFMTGDSKKICRTIKASFPQNVVLTGYIDHAEFMALMNKCDIVLALTKRKDTVLWSIREIMALGKPFVTSDSEVLRHYFSDIAIFSKHKPNSLKKALEEAWNKRFEIKGNIEKFRANDAERWRKDMAHINAVIAKSNKDVDNYSRKAVSNRSA